MSIPFTYSNYSALRRCGRYFKYSVVDKLPQPPQTHFEFGSAMHAGMHTLLIEHDVESAQDVFEAYWSSSHSKLDFKGERHSADALADMGVKFIANFHRRLGKDMKLIVAEQRMKSDFTIPCEGTPDALVEWGGKNILLDYKTSAYNYDPIKTDISLQLNLYAWLLEQNGYKVDAMCYLVFNKGTGSIQTPHIAQYDSKKALDMIGEAVQVWLREQGHYERNPNSCIIGKQVCPFAKECWD